MQHQFWITKKTVQRKFGSKEDEHIVSSDAELDTKIEIFKSISSTSADLSKIIDQYQERLCILSQEECLFGRFLKEAGKRSKTTGQTIINAGKAVSYCGQHRMCVRVPLLRLHHELDVFRCRAITDMQNTITIMEKERTEYRAALEWMKSASTELDPDTGRGLDKFRTAQSHVRNSKMHFDSLTMDSIQKIDLLAAARCNMFSHVLLSYMSELKQFAQKANSTFEAISKTVEHKPKYDFSILKELTQPMENSGNSVDNTAFDKDQSLFFGEDYVDNEPILNENKTNEINNEMTDNNLIEISNNSKSSEDLYYTNPNELVELNANEGLIKDMLINMDTTGSISPKPITENCETLNSSATENAKPKNKNVKTNQWLELFADLDPLANLEAFDLKLNGICKNVQQT